MRSMFSIRAAGSRRAESTDETSEPSELIVPHRRSAAVIAISLEP